jgi:hypothetical protein
MEILAVNHNINGFADTVPRVDAPGGAAKFLGGSGKNEVSFADLLDFINPLHHIPVVSTVYRALTGDTISPAARLAGGALFGGPIGFVSSLANLVIEDATGRDVGAHLMAMAGFDAKPTAAATAIAAISPANPSPAELGPPAQPLAAAPASASGTGAASGSERGLARKTPGKPLYEPLPLPANYFLGRKPASAPTPGPAAQNPRAEDMTAQQLAERLLSYTAAREAATLGQIPPSDVF